MSSSRRNLTGTIRTVPSDLRRRLTEHERRLTARGGAFMASASSGAGGMHNTPPPVGASTVSLHSGPRGQPAPSAGTSPVPPSQPSPRTRALPGARAAYPDPLMARSRTSSLGSGVGAAAGHHSPLQRRVRPSRVHELRTRDGARLSASPISTQSNPDLRHSARGGYSEHAASFSARSHATAAKLLATVEARSQALPSPLRGGSERGAGGDHSRMMNFTGSPSPGRRKHPARFRYAGLGSKIRRVPDDRVFAPRVAPDGSALLLPHESRARLEQVLATTMTPRQEELEARLKSSTLGSSFRVSRGRADDDLEKLAQAAAVEVVDRLPDTYDPHRRSGEDNGSDGEADHDDSAAQALDAILRDVQARQVASPSPPRRRLLGHQAQAGASDDSDDDDAGPATSPSAAAAHRGGGGKDAASKDSGGIREAEAVTEAAAMSAAAAAPDHVVTNERRGDVSSRSDQQGVHGIAAPRRAQAAAGANVSGSSARLDVDVAAGGAEGDGEADEHTAQSLLFRGISDASSRRTRTLLANLVPKKTWRVEMLEQERLDSFLSGYGSEAGEGDHKHGTFASAALFCEVKLRELRDLRRAYGDPYPSPFHTAAVFSLLESMFKRLSGFAPSLQPLLEEVLASVYLAMPLHSTAAAPAASAQRDEQPTTAGAGARGRPTTPRSKARITPLQETAVTIKRLLAGTPYYVAARELEVKVHSLEVAAELQKRQGMLTNLRDAFFTRMSARHNKAILWAIFQLWKQQTEKSRARREAAMKWMTALFVGRQALSLREVFEAWRMAALHGSRQRMRDKIAKLTRDMEALEYTMEVETGKHKRTQQALARSNEENRQLRADLRLLKLNSHRTQLVLHLRKVIGSLTHTVRTLSSTTLSLLYKGAVEAVSVPDASRLWEVVRQEDVDAAARALAKEAQQQCDDAAAAAERAVTQAMQEQQSAAAQTGAAGAPERAVDARVPTAIGTATTVGNAAHDSTSGAGEGDGDVAAQVVGPGTPTVTVPQRPFSFGPPSNSSSPEVGGLGVRSSPVVTPRSLVVGDSATPSALRSSPSALRGSPSALRGPSPSNHARSRRGRTVTFSMPRADAGGDADDEREGAGEAGAKAASSQVSPRAQGVTSLRASVNSLVAIRKLKQRVQARKGSSTSPVATTTALQLPSKPKPGQVQQTMHTPQHVRKQFRPLSSDSLRRAQRLMSPSTRNSVSPRSAASTDTEPLTEAQDDEDEVGWGYNVHELADTFHIEPATEEQLRDAAKQDAALVSAPSYASLPPLERRIRTLELLSHLPIERVLLLWLNYHMKIAHKLGANPRGRGVRNLKRDLQDGEVLLTVMQQVAHKKAPKVALDPLERAERIVTTAAQLSPPVAPFLTPGHLVDGAEPLMQALAAELFTTHPGLHTSGAEYKAMHNVLARVIIAWDGVVPALAVLGAEEALPAEGDLDSDLWRSGEDIMNGRSVRAAGESAALFSRGQDEDGKSGAATPASYIARHARGFRRFDNDKSFEGLLDGCTDHNGGKALELHVTKEMRAMAEQELAHFDFTALGVGAKEDLINLQMALPLIQRYAKSVAQAERAVRGALEWCQLGHRVFHEVNQRMVTHVWKLFYFQLLKPPERESFVTSDPVELRHFYNVEPQRLKDVLRECTQGPRDAARQLRRMRRMLFKVRGQLSKMYRHYSHSGTGGGTGTALTSNEFWRFVKDIKFAEKNQSSATHIDLIFSYATAHDKRELDSVFTRELGPQAWVSTLVRMAAKKFWVAPPRRRRRRRSPLRQSRGSASPTARRTSPTHSSPLATAAPINQLPGDGKEAGSNGSDGDDTASQKGASASIQEASDASAGAAVGEAGRTAFDTGDGGGDGASAPTVAVPGAGPGESKGAEDGVAAAGTDGVSLAKALHMLLHLHVLPFACRTDADRFRKDIGTPAMREVFAKHRKDLVRVFAHYAQSDMQTPGAASHLDTINMIEWNKMLRETNLMDVYLTEVVSRQIFSSAQMDDEFEALGEFRKDGPSMPGEMTFGEFQEALCALATFKQANPYMELHVRVDTFITEDFLPRAGKIKMKKTSRIAKRLLKLAGAARAMTTTSGSARGSTAGTGGGPSLGATSPRMPSGSRSGAYGSPPPGTAGTAATASSLASNRSRGTVGSWRTGGSGQSGSVGTPSSGGAARSGKAGARGVTRRSRGRGVRKRASHRRIALAASAMRAQQQQQAATGAYPKGGDTAEGSWSPGMMQVLDPDSSGQADTGDSSGSDTDTGAAYVPSGVRQYKTREASFASDEDDRDVDESDDADVDA